MKDSERLKALNRLLEHCKNSPFYRSRLPDGPLGSLEEIKNLPITKKEDLRHYSPKGFICVPKKELYQYHETFGTTGDPASTWLTRDDFLDYAGRVNEFGINFSDEDIVLIRFPYALSSVAHFVHEAAQMKGACVVPASSRNIITPFSRVVNLMRKLEVTVLASLPLQALLIAETAEMMGFKPDRDFPCLRVVYTAGELMPPRRRKMLKEIWGVPVIDNYGMTEIGPAVIDCEYGVPHPLQDYFIFEVLDEELKDEVKEGGTGYLVVTALTKKATPIIRYLTGDRARLIRKDCPCGRKYSMEIRGRSQDVVVVGDKVFDSRDLEDMLEFAPGCKFWAAGPQKGRLKFVVEESETGECIGKDSVKMLEGKFGAGMDFDIVPKGSLYDRNQLLQVGVVGKPRYIYSEQEMADGAYFNSQKV